MDAAAARHSQARLDRFVDAPEIGPGWRKDPFTQEALYSDEWLAPADRLLSAPPELGTHERPGKERGPADPEAAEQIRRARATLRDDLAQGRVHGTGSWPPHEQREAWARQIAVDSLRRAAVNVRKLVGFRPEDREFLEQLAAAVEFAAEEVSDAPEAA